MVGEHCAGKMNGGWKSVYVDIVVCRHSRPEICRRWTVHAIHPTPKRLARGT
jgi:hypothetical protein